MTTIIFKIWGIQRETVWSLFHVHCNCSKWASKVPFSFLQKKPRWYTNSVIKTKINIRRTVSVKNNGRGAKASYMCIIVLLFPTVRFFNQGWYSGNLVRIWCNYHHIKIVSNLTSCITHLSSTLG